MAEKILDLGAIQVHKKVIAEIVYNAIKDIKGVHLIKKNFLDFILSVLNKNYFPGLKIRVDDKQEVTIEVKVTVLYGLNIPDIASQIQDIIKSAVETSVNIILKKVNVNVQGVERGK